MWLDGRFDLSVVERIPVGIFEEWMPLHFSSTTTDVSQPAGAVHCAERTDNVLRMVRDGRLSWEHDWLFNNPNNMLALYGGITDDMNNSLLVDLDGGLMPEWRISSQEFIDENSQRPPVDGCGMALVLYHLWREILGRSA